MPRKGDLATALDLPVFLLGVFMLYWSVPLSVLLGKIQFWKLRGKRDDSYGWAKGLQQLFGVKILQLPGPELYRGENVIYLANHRSWADFFLDVVMTDGRAQMLSRLAVMIVFPAFMVPVLIIKSVILFKRGNKIDKTAFNARIDRMMRESPVQGLIVYPEGHRSTKTDSLSLKRGMLHYCYDNKRTVQIVMTRNKEAVLSEKDLSCHLGQTCLVGYADPINPSSHGSFEAFVAAVQLAWDAEWKRIYSAELSEGRKKEDASYDIHEYPAKMKLLQLFATGGSCLLFLTTMYWTVRGFSSLLALTGPFKVLVASFLTLWIGTSFVCALQPVYLPKDQKAV